MQDTKIIGDPAKDRTIDYRIIDKLNKECEAKARKQGLKEKLEEEKRRKKEEKEPAAEPAQPPDRTYIRTPDELRDIKSNYSLQHGVYVIDFDIYVPQGCGLILEPGVEFYFTKDAGITCEGRFEAKGEDGLEVLLTAKNKDKGWKNLYLRKKGKGILDYARFSYGKGRKNRRGNISGGAVLLEAKKSLTPSITINNSCFESNSAAYGGALYNFQANIKINNNNRFENNSITLSGGAIYNHRGDIKINENNRFEKNSAGWGGAICNFQAYLTIEKNNRFEKNSAKYKGGAIRSFKGNLDIDKSKNIFKNNKPDDIFK